MKARFFSLLLLITLGSAACAQVKQSIPHWSIDLLAGPAFPVGKYAGGDQPEGDTGPVRPGGLLELSGIYHLNDHFGITLLADGQINQVKYHLSFGTLTTSGGIEPQTPPFDNWKIARLLTGVVYTLPLTKNKKLDLLVRVLGGIQKTRTAGFEDLNVDYSPIAAQSLPWAFSYQGDLGLKWHPHGRLSLIAYGGYNGSRSSSNFPTGSLLFRSGVSLAL